MFSNGWIAEPSQKDKSIITRIETRFQQILSLWLSRSKRQIHHNKDWNHQIKEPPQSTCGQKDKSIITRIETSVITDFLFLLTLSKRQIHHNKDWNKYVRISSSIIPKCQKDKSIITRIETFLWCPSMRFFPVKKTNPS